MMDARERDRIPEESIEPILARAAELDRRASETVDVAVLRSAALEAGISLDAVNRAVEEYAAGVRVAETPADPPSPPTAFQPGRRRMLLIACSLGALAAGAGAVLATGGPNAPRLGVALLLVAAAALLGRLARGGSGRGLSAPGQDKDSASPSL